MMGVLNCSIGRNSLTGWLLAVVKAAGLGAIAGGGGDAGDAAAAHNGRSLCITHLTLGAPYITVCAGPARQAAAVAAAEATTRPRICIQQHTMAPSVFFQLEIYYRTNVRRTRLPSLFSRLVSRQNTTPRHCTPAPSSRLPPPISSFLLLIARIHQINSRSK